MFHGVLQTIRVIILCGLIYLSMFLPDTFSHVFSPYFPHSLVHMGSSFAAQIPASGSSSSHEAQNTVHSSAQVTPQDAGELNVRESFMGDHDSTLHAFFHAYEVPLLLLVIFIGMAHFTTWYIIDKRKKKKLLRHLHVDSLTGLATEYKFTEIVEDHLKEAKPGQYVIESIDIDNFNLVNQNYGHKKGSELLVQVAKNLCEIYHMAISMARFRDDLFFIFRYCPEDRSLVEKNVACMKKISCDAQDILCTSFTLSMSKGSYIIDNPTLSLSQMKTYCKVARLRGKTTYGFTNTLFTQEMESLLDMRTRILHHMESAIAQKEFVVFFQPKVGIKDQAIIGAEALVRWQTRDGVMIGPDNFIPMFEENGFIARLDYYVFEMVCQYITEYRELLPIPPIAVNLSGLSVINRTTASILQGLILKYGISSKDIEIEITESAMVSESDDFLYRIHDLKHMGFSIALDDFGIGVSSLNRLRTLPLDVVKLDKSFLDANMEKARNTTGGNSAKGCAIVRHVVNMLKDIGIKTVAEGVETEDHVHWITDVGCDIAQGYFFSKPLTGEDFFALLKNDAPFARQKAHEQLVRLQSQVQR